MSVWLSIAVGATLGAWLRWQLSLWVVHLGWLVWGTLVANALGGFLMGMVLAVLHSHIQWSPALRLFITTGFLGGLTTFSTFSAEAFVLIQRSQYLYAVFHVLLHVLLSIALTCIGYWLVNRVLTS